MQHLIQALMRITNMFSSLKLRSYHGTCDYLLFVGGRIKRCTWAFFLLIRKWWICYYAIMWQIMLFIFNLHSTSHLFGSYLSFWLQFSRRLLQQSWTVHVSAGHCMSVLPPQSLSHLCLFLKMNILNLQLFWFGSILLLCISFLFVCLFVVLFV